ncbi:MAG: GMC family oxidoreductase [Gammaproteobacteria bacterium]
MEERYDYIIAGAGSAGCVLANRLSEDRSVRVLILEAGGAANSPLISTPGGSIALMQNPKYDWSYETEPDPSIAGRQLRWSGGKALGGSSSINGMVYIRGLRRDYDEWVQEFGCPGWGWNDVLPYFVKSETFNGPPSQAHGYNGPLQVSPQKSIHPLSAAFIEACTQQGLPRLDDYCDWNGDGAFMNYATQRDGRRWSSAQGSLGAAAGRPNLTVLTEALADRVLFEGRRASGLRVRHAGTTRDFHAAREVIVAAGALQSPGLLMRSGIGPGAQLSALGIAPVVDAPGVGRNLQDHCGVNISKLTNVSTYNSEMTPLRGLRALFAYLMFKDGPLSSAAVQGMAWLRSAPDLAEPDIHLNFLPYCIDFSITPPNFHKKPGVTLGTCVSRPHSRGEIRLRSADPADKPIIDHRHVGDERDLQALVRACHVMEAIYARPALAGAVVANNMPVRTPQDDREWEAYCRETAGMGFHPVGTCRMGSDAQSVVDPQLRVRGVEALRVVDASVMPRLVSANTNACAIMIGEKAGDLVRGAA